MRKSIIILLLAASLVSSGAATAPAVAHVLESNNGIGAVIHIDPDDDPIAGEESTFYFEFKDKNNKFSAPDCDCSMTVRQNDRVLGTTKLKAVRALSGSASYTLPEQDLYTIEVSGRPLQKDAFASFTFSYSFRAARGVVSAQTSNDGTTTAKSQPAQNNLLLVVGIALMVLFTVGIAAKVVYNLKYKSAVKADKK